MVNPSLKIRAHIDKICASTCIMLGTIWRFFIRLWRKTFELLCITHARQRLKLGGVSLFSCSPEEFTGLECVQGTAIYIILELRRLDYDVRLQLTGLFHEAYHRARRNLICIWCVVRGELGQELQDGVALCDCNRTRAHAFKLEKLESTGLPLVYRLSRQLTHYRQLWRNSMAIISSRHNHMTTCR